MNRRDLLTLLFSMPLPLLGQAAADEAARRLLRRMQEALGGPDRLSAVRDVDWTIAAKTWDRSGVPGPDVERRTRWIAPNIFRKDQRNGERVVRYFFDGVGGWELAPGAGLVDLAGQELAFVRGEATGAYPQKWLPDRRPGHRVVSGGPNAIRVLGPNGKPGKDIVVDPETSLPLRLVGATRSGKIGTAYTRVPQRLEFREWRSLDGIMWPQRLVNFHHDVKLADMTTTKVAINVGLNVDELARRPVV